MSHINLLNELPNGFAETTDIITQLDRCFLTGFARLGQGELDTLASLQRIYTGTPLSEQFDEACSAMTRNEFMTAHFVSFAVIRTALQGAQFDALQQQARSAFNRPTPTEISTLEPQAVASSSPIAVWLDSTQQWLMEIAVSGFAQLDRQTVLPFLTTLEQMQAEPALISLAALLTGLLDELLHMIPVNEPSQIPLYRWVDLWSRAMIASMPRSVSPPAIAVSGMLKVLGFELRQHAHFISFVAHGILNQEDAEAQVVRITLSSYKVDAIRGDERWLLLPHILPLIECLSKGKALQLVDVPLLPTGDLIWSETAQFGSAFDPMAEAEMLFSTVSASPIQPCYTNAVERHPIQLSEPIFLSGYKVSVAEETAILTWEDETMLPVAVERLDPTSEITIETVAKSNQLFGLLRFDGGQWAVQPLTIATKKGKSKPKMTFIGQQGEKLLNKAAKQSTVSILQERASRLLRK